MRALHQSEVFIQNVTVNPHYAMNESKRTFISTFGVLNKCLKFIAFRGVILYRVQSSLSPE